MIGTANSKGGFEFRVAVHGLSDSPLEIVILELDERHLPSRWETRVADRRAVSRLFEDSPVFETCAAARLYALGLREHMYVEHGIQFHELTATFGELNSTVRKLVRPKPKLYLAVEKPLIRKDANLAEAEVTVPASDNMEVEYKLVMSRK